MRKLGIALLVLFAVQALGEELKERLAAEGELAPFPEAQGLLVEIGRVIDSAELKTVIKDSRTLQMLRERVRTSLFHLNFEFQVKTEGYPYEPPFKKPFPFRPTLETIDEAQKFLKEVELTTGFKASGVQLAMENMPEFAELRSLIPAAKSQPVPRAIDKKEMAAKPVDAYLEFQKRLKTHGENASFPEFAEAMNGVLEHLRSDELTQMRLKDPTLNRIVEQSISDLTALGAKKGGAETRLHGAYTAPYPYRKTLQMLERAVTVLDIKERLKYPEGINWHDVEVSWFVGNSPKVLPLYHFNRYKYQLAGLLADHEMVMFPDWGGSNFEYLNRLRTVPIGVLEIMGETSRIDRHHNTPLDNFYHDANHARRMWGYDQRKQEKRGATTDEAKIAIYREQEAFMNDLLAATNPKAPEVKGNAHAVAIRKLMNAYAFETFHETALTPDRDSLIYDLTRKPATRQPFEVQIQNPINDLEDIRSFDGNLRSGADQLALNLRRPTIVQYFLDRAPGFHANVDNKLRWGFFDSVFDQKKYVVDPQYRKPMFLAEAAHALFQYLGYENPPSLETLMAEMVDRSGQRELWNYFDMDDTGIVRLSGLNMLQVAAADEIHATWRRNTLHEERWKPTNAKLEDGSMVIDEYTLQRYLEEKKIPEYLHQFYRLDKNEITGEVVMWEDIRNLPNQYLAVNHQGENLMSGAKAVSVVDRIWHKELKFRNLDAAEAWIVQAAQMVHQGVLDRNANGARNNPEYNVHWLRLKPQFKVNDLELIRIAFEARQKVGRTKLDPETATMFSEGISRLYRKIRRGEPIWGGCRFTTAQADT